MVQASLEGGTMQKNLLIRRKVTALLVNEYQAVLDRHEWNITQAAKELGVTRAAVYKIIDRYALEWPEGRKENP
jgi:transcriptional regulator of acetoin/glycerol metabolism